MGQKPSRYSNGIKFSLPLFFRWSFVERNPNPEQPIKFQYKTRRKTNEEKCNNSKGKEFSRIELKEFSGIKTLNNFTEQKRKNKIKNNNEGEVKCRIIKTLNAASPLRTRSEPNLISNEKKEKHRCKKKGNGKNKDSSSSFDFVQKFGYEIEDVDSFLTKATIEKPANIPIVLSCPSILYQTRIGGYQSEVSLPLGMVVNAVFKNQNWLYVQTPHGEEGYVSYAACLPLGIIPPSEDVLAPCWEKNSDVFPKPSGNMTDTEKLSSKSDCSFGGRCCRRSAATSVCDEKSVDKLYLRATISLKKQATKRPNFENQVTRQTLLAIFANYLGNGGNTLDVYKGDVVTLLNSNLYGWFWVRNKEGKEGFIPSAIAGYGFL